jgi:signal transduction histidine kinase
MNKVYQNKNFWSYLILIASLVLFVGSFIFKAPFLNETSLEYKEKELQKGIHKQERDAIALLKDTALIRRLSENRETQNDIDLLYNKPYGLYLYKGAENSQPYLHFWNTATIIIPDSVLHQIKDEKLEKLANGYYLIKKIPAENIKDVSLYYAILVQSTYYLNSTDYAKETFPIRPDLTSIASVSETPTSDAVETLSGNTSIYLQKKTTANIDDDSPFFVIIRLVSFFFFFLALYFLLFKNVVRRYKFADIPLFLCCLLTFRILLYVCRDVFKLNSLELFGQQLYNANIILPSFGDLLLNSALFCWFGIFIWNRIKPDETIQSADKAPARIQWLRGSLYIALLLLLTFIVVNVIRSIISNSKVSFDVTNFFGLSVYTAIGFIILAFLSFGFHYFSRILFYYLFPAFRGRVYLIYLFIALAGLSYIAIMGSGSGSLYLICLAWLLIYTFLFNNERSLNKLIRFNISGTIVWIFIFSVSISFLMLSEIDNAELKQRKIYIEKLNVKSDSATERLIVMANVYLDNDFFEENYNRFYDQAQNEYLRDSILSNNYSRYRREYTPGLYLFDSLNRPMFNTGDLSYESLQNIILRQSTPTNSPDLYIYEPSYEKFAYITHRRIVNDSGALVGTVWIISKPKKYSPDAIRPELFRQSRDSSFFNSPVYNYAVYSKNLLVTSSKKYPFTSTLLKSQIPKTTFELRENNGYSELWYRAGYNKIIVMTRKNERVLETITLFSYIFCAFLFLVALIQLVSNILNFALNKGRLKKQLRFSTSIRGQIHNTFILITLLSFLVIGIATISFFTKRFDDSNSEHLGRTMSIMLNEMQSHTEIGSLVYEQADSLNSQRLEEIMKRVADIHGVDVNLYNFRGNLLATSHPDLYDNGVLSSKIDPRAYYYLQKLRHIEHTQKEKIWDRKYTNMYAPLRNKDGTFYAYLSIPYFISEQVLNEEISRFLITLINLNAFIFLITGLVALLITNRITHSFALIKDKLMQVNLSKHNEMIIWEKNDEIGSLVTEYNKMVTKLQVSADALAKSERQEAWREMARQVAHEIKNPLTPMKLSLQYLQRAIDNDSPNVQQLTFNVSKTLVEQIDHLSKIAADFSQFANINQVKTEIFDLHEVIQPLIVIYSKNPEVDLLWQPLSQPITVFADKTHMNRVFTNLFGNAIEAAREDVTCKMTVKERIEGNKVYVSVSDNGVGIKAEMLDKIFTPNFTTKTSGTGLGLAMCKTIIEQAGGEITFETDVNKGTTFHIELPLVD